MQALFDGTVFVGIGIAIIGLSCLVISAIRDVRLWLSALRGDRTAIFIHTFITQQILFIAAGFLCMGIGLMMVYPDLSWLLPYWFVVGAFFAIGSAINLYIRIRLRNTKSDHQN